MRILIAAADRQTLAILENGLDGRGGIAVAGTAADGERLLALAEKFLPKAIIADAVLPRMDGLAFLEKLPGTLLERLPYVFLLTCPGMERMEEKAIIKGAAGVFQKPVEIPDILSAMARIAADTGGRSVSGENIARTLNEIGVPRNLIGYTYLYEAIAIAAADSAVLAALGERIYLPIARRRGTSPSKVERSMRFAIESAWNRGRVDKIEAMFGYTVKSEVGRPTNGEFVAMAAERVRLAATKGGRGAFAKSGHA